MGCSGGHRLLLRVQAAVRPQSCFSVVLRGSDRPLSFRLPSVCTSHTRLGSRCWRSGVIERDSIKRDEEKPAHASWWFPSSSGPESETRRDRLAGEAAELCLPPSGSATCIALRMGRGWGCAEPSTVEVLRAPVCRLAALGVPAPWREVANSIARFRPAEGSERSRGCSIRGQLGRQTGRVPTRGVA